MNAQVLLGKYETLSLVLIRWLESTAVRVDERTRLLDNSPDTLEMLELNYYHTFKSGLLALEKQGILVFDLKTNGKKDLSKCRYTELGVWVANELQQEVEIQYDSLNSNQYVR